MARYDRVADPQIRQGLADAHARMKRGEYTEAVRGLSDLFLTIIDKHPAILTQPPPPDSFSVHGGWIDVYSAALRPQDRGKPRSGPLRRRLREGRVLDRSVLA